MALELKGLQEQEKTTIEFLNTLRSNYAIQSDASIKFTLEKQIAEKEGLLKKIRGQIQEAYGLDVFESSQLLEKQIRELYMDTDIGEIHLVNVNRSKSANRFWDAFDIKIENAKRFQFYFVLACPTQQPNSFSERMIYELIIEELDEELEAINYVNLADSQRVKVEDLPLGRNLRNSKKDFKKYFSRRFGFGAEQSTFEEFLETGLPKLDYEYVATIFDLNASKWNPELMSEYLQWMIDSFSNTHDEVPQFLFFFAIFLKDIHNEPLPSRSKKVLESIKEIVDKNGESCTIMHDLRPVRRDLLEDWIRDLGEQNQSKIEDIIKTIVAGLPKEKRDYFNEHDVLDMSDIERFQEIVYKIANI